MSGTTANALADLLHCHCTKKKRTMSCCFGALKNEPSHKVWFPQRDGISITVHLSHTEFVRGNARWRLQAITARSYRADDQSSTAGQQGQCVSDRVSFWQLFPNSPKCAVNKARLALWRQFPSELVELQWSSHPKFAHQPSITSRIKWNLRFYKSV